MESLAVEFVFHAWDTDVCISLLQSVENWSEGYVLAAAGRKMPVVRG